MILTYDISDVVPYINWAYFYFAWQLKGEAEQNLRSQYPNLEGGAFFTIDCIRNYELIRELWSYGKELIVLSSDNNIQDEIFERLCEMKDIYSKLRTMSS